MASQNTATNQPVDPCSEFTDRDETICLDRRDRVVEDIIVGTRQLSAAKKEYFLLLLTDFCNEGGTGPVNDFMRSEGRRVRSGGKLTPVDLDNPPWRA